MPSSSLPPPAADVVPRFSIKDPDVWLKAVAWVTIVGCALQILTFSFGRDQSIYAVVGDGVLHGEVPYRDLWDFKPPGIFFLYALAQALFGKNMMAPRLLEVLAFFGCVAVMRRIATAVFDNKTVGLVGAAVALLIHAQLEFWHTGQPESFGALFTLLGVMLTVEPNARKSSRCYWIGVTFGCAALLKPPLGGGVLVCLAFLTQRERLLVNKPWQALRPALWVGLGFAVPLLLCLAWFWAKGGVEAMYWTLGRFTPGYTTLGWEGRRASDMLYHAIEEAFFKFSALAAAGVIAAAAMTPLYHREREALFLLLGVITMHVAGIAMQGKFFAYHYGATLPLIALIAGVGLYKLWRRCIGGGLGGALAFFSFVAVAVPMRYAVRDLPQFFWERSWIRMQYLLRMAPYDSRERMDEELAVVADYNLAADRQVARDVRARTRPDQKVYVWGFEPAIYWLSDRAPSSRFIYNVPQRSPWEADYARRELLQDLKDAPPSVVVVQMRDVFPNVVGDALDSNDSLPNFPELQRWLDARYTVARRIEDFDVYTLNVGINAAAP